MQQYMKMIVDRMTVNACLLFQVTDYAIARRIVDLHSRIENSVERVYSLDEIRRYLLFARQFKPKVSDGTTHLHSSWCFYWLK